MSLACRCGGWSSSTGSACCATSSGGTPSTGWSTRTWSPLSRSRTPSTCAAPPPVLRSAAERPTAQVNVDELQKQFNFGAPPDRLPAAAQHLGRALTRGVCWVQGRRTCSARSPSSLATASSGARRRSSSCAAGSTGRTRWRASGTSCPSRCGTCSTRSWPTTATAGAPPARTDTGRCPPHRCWLAQVWDPGAGQELCSAAVPVLLLQEEGRGQEGRRGRCQGGSGRGGRGQPGRRRPRRGRGARARSLPAVAVADAGARAGLRSGGRRWRRRRPTSR